MSAFVPRRTELTPEPSNRPDTDLSSVNPSWDRGLSAALQKEARRALKYEQQIKDLEARLASDLSNSRAIHSSLDDVFTELDQTRRQTDFAAKDTVPHVQESLDVDMHELRVLDERLPKVGQQVRDIRRVYDSGRDKAHDLVASLEWLNTPIFLRLRTIIFTADAPVSNAWKACVRTLFALTFLVCAWIAWLTLRGAMRAHRQRLVWGERLMS